jgi:FdhD protein
MEEQTSQAGVVCVRADGTSVAKQEEVILEHRLQIFVNGQLAMALTCTPTHLEELVVGRMISEGYIRSLSEIDMIYICEEGFQAKVFLKENVKLIPTLYRETTCCTDNKNLHQTAYSGEKLQKLENSENVKIEPEKIFKLANRFREDNQIHKKTSGTHSCYLMCDQEIIGTFEDIGRHNALDKAIGSMLLQEKNPEKCILFTTGRVPCDMVRKVIRAGVPVFVSKSVTTAEAIGLAKEYDLHLIGRAWPDSYEIYN